ncbi:flagellar basal body-associated FliL family protein [Elioraea sp.]|uniref:flagellar basal body-associated FliL family protein n=1 Tax=Elioraea sp. TaxID=2185103 RepID=UPI003F7241A2
MAGSASVAEDDAATAEQPAPTGRRKLILLAAPVVVAALGGGLWFSGVLPGLLGLGGASEPPAEVQIEPALFSMPDIIVNLNVGAGRRPSYLKLVARIEIADSRDLPSMDAVVPRLQDLFTTYLRELRPEELRGSVGMHRLREELTARAKVAAHPVAVTDVLFVEMLVQ